MYFDDAAEKFDAPAGREITYVVLITAAFTALFFLYTGPLLSGADAAATALMPATGDAVQAALSP